MGHSGVSLSDVVITGPVRQGSSLTKSRNRTHDQAGINLLDRLVVQAQASNCTRRIVLDQNVHLLHQRLENLQALRVLGVKAEALFAAVLLDEVGAAAPLQERQRAREVPVRG